MSVGPKAGGTRRPTWAGNFKSKAMHLCSSHWLETASNESDSCRLNRFRYSTDRSAMDFVVVRNVLFFSVSKS